MKALIAVLLFAVVLAIAAAINYGLSRAIVWALSEGFGVHVPVLPVCVLLFVGGFIFTNIARAARP